MYILALHYTTSAEDAQVQALAQVLGKTAYEVRSRLTIPAGGPAVVGGYASLEQAQTVAGQLRDRGFTVLLLEEDEVDPSQTQFEVRGFSLEGQQLVVESRQGKQRAIQYGDIDLLLRGVRFSTGEETQTVTQKKFSLGRTVMSSGMIRNKKTKATIMTEVKESENFLHVYAGSQPAFVFSENALLYNSLGSAMKPSRAANFLYIVNEMRRLAAHATFDDRCLRKAGQKQLLGPSMEPESHFDIATHLLAKVLRPQPKVINFQPHVF